MTLKFNNKFEIQPSSEGGGGGGGGETNAPNLALFGNLAVNNGVISGFSSTAYAVLPIPNKDAVNPRNFEMVIKFTTGNAVNGDYWCVMGQRNQNFYTPQIEIGDNKCAVICSTNGTSWGVGIEAPVQANTTYTLKFRLDSGLATDGKLTGTLTQEGQSPVTMTVTSGKTNTAGAIYWKQEALLGSDGGGTTYIYNGSIDLKDSYIKLNGADWWTGTR